MYPFNFKMGQRIQTNAEGVAVDRGFIAHIEWKEPVPEDADLILATQVTDDQEETIVDEFLAQPDYPRQISITPGGTTGDVAAGNIIVSGTNAAGEVISEDVAIEADASTAVYTSMAFATVTSIIFPKQDGVGATFDVGVTEKLGLPYALERDTVIAAYLDNTREGTAPTVTTDTDWTKNLIELNSALDGSNVDVYLVV